VAPKEGAMHRLLLGLIFVAMATLAGCATQSATQPASARWFVTIRTEAGPYNSEAACQAAMRSARASLEAQSAKGTVVCELR
jgi:predicted outer membrane protein